jgi:hypothetical protein
VLENGRKTVAGGPQPQQFKYLLNTHEMPEAPKTRDNDRERERERER